VRLALDNNPNLNVARQEQSIQSLERPRAFSSFLPTLDAEGTYVRFQEKQRVVPAHRNNELGVFDEDFLEGGLVLRLPIFQGGRRVAAYRIAELAGKLASEQLTTTQQDLVLNVASVFYKTLQLEQVIRATEASREALQSQTATTRLRVEVGRSAPVDSMKVEVRLASIEQGLSRLEADRRLLLVQLGRLLGMSGQGQSVPRIAGQLQAVPQPLPDVEGAKVEAREQRSELKAALLQLEQAEKNLDAVRADYWPRVDGFARYGSRTGLPVDQKDDSKALDHETTWATGVQVDIPLFRGGAVRTQVAQARLRIDQARERLRDVDLLIGEDLDRAFTVLSDSRNRIGVTGKNVDAAAETLRIEQTTYQEGRNTINDVLDAQTAKLTADVEYSQAVVDHLLARLDWERALGNDLATYVGRFPSNQD
jgi:outer membrane protein TolC